MQRKLGPLAEKAATKKYLILECDCENAYQHKCY